MAARRGWRYFATRLHGDGTETMIHPDVPLEDVTVDNVLSGDNAVNAKISPVTRSLLGADGKPLFREWSTALYAENDGDIRGGGILTSSEFNGPDWDIECVGLTGYSRDMPYTGSGYKGIEVDPIDVARLIWAHIQGHKGGDIGLEFDQVDTDGEVSIGTELEQVEYDTQEGPVSFESGPYKLNAYTNHDLHSDFDGLANDTPFDYHERHYWDSDGVLRHHVDIGYPKLGRRRDDLSFTYGVNIFDNVSVDRDGSLFASGTLVLGAGDGAAAIRALSEPTGGRDGRLRRIAVVVDDTIKSRKRANARADRENQWRARLDDVSSVVVVDHPDAPLGAAKVGDEIKIRGRGDWVGVDLWVRVLAIAVQPATGNVAEYTIARTDKLMS